MKRKRENYRPISLLSSISKVFEKLLQSRIRENSIISGNQNGCRPKRSCIAAIVSITEFIRTVIDIESRVQARFIDLHKTFGTLEHNILLQKV